MTEVMKTQMLQTVLSNDIMEVLSHISRRDHITVVITADEAVKLLVVALAAGFFELSFHLFLFKKHLLDTISRVKGQSADKEKALIAESFSIINFDSSGFKVRNLSHQDQARSRRNTP